MYKRRRKSVKMLLSLDIFMNCIVVSGEYSKNSCLNIEVLPY